MTLDGSCCEIKSEPAPTCPVGFGKNNSPNATKNNNDLMIPAVCPVKGEKNTLNPLNNMPHFIDTKKLPGQQLDLPIERIISSIPRGTSENEGNWEYPSPQQMFNAMIRKGKGEVPEDAVESMVDVHNFLNEGAWQQILEWEQPYIERTNTSPRLLKFTGRPSDLSPKARMYLLLGKIFPETYNTEPPFDRHDWTVLRKKSSFFGDSTSLENGNEADKNDWQKVRYVIDYYGGPDDAHGMPTFFLDVRPALDNFTNAKDRFQHWAGPLWRKAMGDIEDDN
ncbi:holocytochrome c synthase CYC3 [Ascoidea rubescens DSM 1968]|uniref:Holocytochrome c-type synthase n=1 Tax=Ascoidea rubescens DSM 1968 TaxID=1344418 RepID=A0A1D2VNI5_9ASCO|nr:cytochrome c and c1 heme-lyase [Ascoidea rubescens DSM 1968]ODV63144.1 cytochrome c and c1 heme-lyase [Ascoidea rubescens DSM 1968]